MSCASSPTPPAADAWCARLPSRHTKTGWRRTDISTWTTCANTRRPNYAKPHDQHHDRQFAELDAHNPEAMVAPAARSLPVSARWALAGAPSGAQATVAGDRTLGGGITPSIRR